MDLNKSEMDLNHRSQTCFNLGRSDIDGTWIDLSMNVAPYKVSIPIKDTESE